MIYNDKHWRAFFHAIGDPDWSKDAMFASMRSRTENIGVVLAKVAEVMEQRSTDDWMALLREAQIPAMPIASLADLLVDPHLVQTGFWEECESDAGRLRFPGIPTRFSGTPGAIGDPGPALGADSRAILAEAGLTESQIDALIESGAARLPRSA
jgi:crotonobetainyl-CoA:carnitine CoA-transferase CaiB-like acyl-CoA transferase